MLLRQHRSIDSLTDVVKTQANTIAGLVSFMGAGGAGAAAGGFGAAAAAPGRRADAAGGGGVRPSGKSGSGAVDDEDAIAEMVAYLDDEGVTPAPAVVGL